MAERERLGLRLRIFLFFALLLCVSAVATGAGIWVAAGRIGDHALPHLVLGAGGAWFVTALVILLVWQKFDENVARPILALSHELERESTESAARAGVNTAPARYLGKLGPAIERAVEALGQERAATAAKIASATREAESAKARLESVLSELKQAVIICNRQHLILLYNTEAVRLLGVAENVGLGRPLSALMLDEPIRHALERVEARYRAGRHLTHPDGLSIAVLTATATGQRTLAGRLGLIVDGAGGDISGFAVSLGDVTHQIEAASARDRLIWDTIESLTPALSALSAIGELFDEPDAPQGVGRAAFDAAITAESRHAADAIAKLAERHAGLKSGVWPMEDTFSPTLFACIVGRLPMTLRGSVSIEGEGLWLHAETYSIVELLAHVIRRLAPEAGRVSLLAERRGGNVSFDLVWTGELISLARLESWLAEPLEHTLGQLTGRDVLARHRTGFLPNRAPDGRARLRLPLGSAIHDHEGAPAMPLPKRPEFYDFDLMNRALPADLAGQDLRHLNYVVFDTETTGLNPGRGDQIVQVAGVRIVNGRLLRGEVFDELVNPGRPIPAASTRIHHITDAMVADRPPVEPVLRRFHTFAKGAVLIAHNAAFDMRFLELRQEQAGVRFDHPVLDTVLLSALISDPADEHTLDALAERFGITLLPEERHTALGDSIATGAVFLRMLDLLAARGIRTLADAQEASDTMVALRRRQSY
ncbi:DNA polymerase III subunit epsilon [Limibaculum sp. M0105]|uniref:DNA-directed DNA polymerase n=1 Tax=Thermohalobaculum xanthum TaxID=2753746 RepID=A0A8J7SHS9_9RHOB|nr:PAS domain-containing protein [Thermohalobaculum xanthum]MBK0400947.1 DNA polymerase III subunit epsilon [Thermohalobaculum xanthum]